jgi:endonuclease/exonuclease/phosphatase (EEP) superfamily protein YafD
MMKSRQKTLTLRGIVDAAAIGLAAATLFGFLGRFFWFFDLFSHFRVQYMQIGLVLIAVSLWKRMNKRAIALIVLAGLNYAFVLPLYFGKPSPAGGQSLRAMLINLNASNGNTEQVLKLIREVDPDLLLLEEVTLKWAAELAVLENDYPHRLARTREDPFGIMLLSKYHLERGEVISIGSSDLPSIIAEGHFPQGIISIIGTHPPPPIGPEYARHRNTQLMELPYLAANQKYPTLLIGDLNVSPFSYWFKRVRETGLKDSAKGFGFQPTWPSNLRVIRIPLDHVLYSPGITIHNRWVGGDAGSDHFPVIVDFTID